MQIGISQGTTSNTCCLWSGGTALENMGAGSHMLLISETQRTGKRSQMGGACRFTTCLCGCITGLSSSC